MRQISVEGLDLPVEIEGDQPTEEETSMIFELVEQKKEEVRMGETALLSGDPDDDEPPTQKQQTRKAIEDAPGLVGPIAEMTPSTVGTVVGGTLGGIATRGNPLGILAGGAIGGAGTEFVAQKLGISPESDLNLALAGAGPILGPGAGFGARFVARLGGAATRNLPFTRTALARINLANAADEFESLGTKLKARPTGPVQAAKEGGFEPLPSGELYKQVRELGVIVSPDELIATTKAIEVAIADMATTKSFPQVKSTIKALEAVRDSVLKDPSGVSMDTIVVARQQLGRIIALAKSAGGIKLGKTKRVFGALADDMERIAKNPNLTGRAARKANEAITRARFEFAIKDMEAGIERFIKEVPEGGIEINIGGMQKWIRQFTNPKSKLFNKNFTAALKDDLPQLNATLADLAKLGKSRSPGGPASLVLRQRFATTGAIIGGFFGGGPGAAAGAIIAASAPEMMVGAFLSPSGRKFLTRAARLGEGDISIRAWQTLGTILLRGAGVPFGETSFKVPDRGVDSPDRPPVDVESPEAAVL